MAAIGSTLGIHYDQPCADHRALGDEIVYERKLGIRYEKDAGIPLSDVEIVKSKRPDVEVFIYPGAQHGFNCDERASHDKASADIAWPRSTAFFARHLK